MFNKALGRTFIARFANTVTGCGSMMCLMFSIRNQLLLNENDTGYQSCGRTNVTTAIIDILVGLVALVRLNDVLGRENRCHLKHVLK